ncbi:MAG: HepT-like ribonuclease domain-containing protein [Candidatus Binatia bacterium]
MVRALTIIGEAVKKVPKSVQNRYPEVPWKMMAGMRDIVIHEYFRVDLKRVFETVRQDLPPLTSAIARILTEMEQRE